MSAWVKCEGISNDVIFVNLSQALMMKRFEAESCTNITFANGITARIRETPEQVIDASADA